MVDRSVVSRLRLEITDYVRNAATAAKVTKAMGDAAEEAAKRGAAAQTQQATLMSRVGDSARKNGQAWTGVGTAVTAFGAAAVAGVGLAVATYARFDQAMSSVQAATHASADEMESLREAAIQAGADTAFSASEAAAGIEELAKAGVSTSDILNGGLTGALDLAAAGGIGVAEAAETAASAMTQFGLAGTDVTHIADLLAAGAGKAQGGVTDMAAALNQSGLVASQMGLDIEETVGSLTAFASAGLIGSDAGTSFRQMLLRLANPTKESAGLMEELGMSFYDSQGEFIGMEGVAGQLQDRLAGLTDEQRNAALAQIFGSDAIRAASILYEEGASGIAEWTAEVDDSGYAAETAALRMDNLKGDLEGLGGSFETLLIRLGESADGPLRGLVQGLDNVVDAVGGLPAPMLAAVTGATALAGGVATATGALMLGVPKFVEFKDSLRVLAEVSPRAAAGIGGMATMVGRLVAFGGALTVTTVALGALANWAKNSANARGADEIADSIGRLVEEGEDLAALRITDIFEDMPTFLGATTIEAENLGDALDTLYNPSATDSLSQFFGKMGLPSYMEDTQQAVEEADAALVEMLGRGGTEGEIARAAIEGLNYSAEELTQRMPEAAAALGLVAEEGVAAGEGATVAAAGAEALGAGMEGAAGMTEEAAEAMQDWFDMVTEADSAFIDLLGAFDAVIAKEKEVAEASAAATESTTDSWEDFFDGQSVNFDEYLAALEAQVAAQTNWEQNMLLLSWRASQGVLDHLAEMGEDGAPLVAAMVDASDEEMARLEAAFGQRSGEATSTFAAALLDAAPVVAAASAQLTDEALNEMVSRLASGELTLQGAIDEYNLMVELGANTDPAATEVAGFVAETDGTTATTNVDADPVSAYAVLNGVLIDVNASRPYVTIDGEDEPAVRTLGQLMQTVGASVEDVTIDGNPAPGHMMLADLMATVRRSNGNVQIGGNNSTGRYALQNLVSAIARSQGFVTVSANTDPAQARLNSFIRDNNGRTVTVYSQMVTLGQAAVATGGYMGDFAQAAGFAGGGAPKRFPGGGLVLGPGSPTSDEIPAWLSTTEFVQKAAAVRKYGLAFMHDVNSLRFPTELARGFSGGGSPSGGGQSQGTYFAPPPALPTHMTLVDADGSILARAQVIAERTVVQAQRQIASVGGVR